MLFRLIIAVLDRKASLGILFYLECMPFKISYVNIDGT